MGGKLSPEARRAYDNARYHRRRADLIRLLGGACAKCGSTEALDIDHIDRTGKRFTFGKEWTRPWAQLVEELKGCQLLCKECHFKKSVEAGDRPPPATHGTVAMYSHSKCRCDKCKEAVRLATRDYRARKRANAGAR